MGSLRGWALVLFAFAYAFAATTATAAQEGRQLQGPGQKDTSGAEEKDEAAAAALATGTITADDVMAAWEAWRKLRDRPKIHTARRRAAEAAAADRKRVRVAEFTLSAESSFTAVSRALDHLANRSRGGAPIAATEFVVEGSVDADTIQSYLRSHAARGSLAGAEAEALSKVVGTLLQTHAHAARTTTAAPSERRRAKRAAPGLFLPQRGR